MENIWEVMVVLREGTLEEIFVGECEGEETCDYRESLGMAQRGHGWRGPQNNDNMTTVMEMLRDITMRMDVMEMV